MNIWMRTRLVTAMLTALIICAPLAAPAQDDKKPAAADDKKKEEELPLKATDKIEFTTDEGTWMSLDVSPDGQTIVFDLLGDIYTLPISGGAARRVIGGLSFESQPKFSPDGKKIAFLSDRSGGENIWISDPDGQNPKPLTKGRNQMFCSPSWTPDGQYVIASKSGESIGTFHLYMYHKDGGTGVSVGPPPPPPPQPGSQGPPPAPPLNKLGAVASPDGRFIYYSSRTGSFSYNAQFPLWQVARFDRDSSETATITRAQGSAMRPVLSPDGKKLVYATRYEMGTALRVRDLETSTERWLVNNVTRDDQESRATRDTMPGYCFMPDGKSLIVPVGGKIQRIEFDSGKATTIPFTAKVEAEIAPRVYFQNRVEDGPTVRARLIRWPALSPDGKQLVFSCLNRLWIMDLPSGTPRRLTNSSVGEFMPAWSPDGRFVAYVTWEVEGGHVSRVAASGGQPQQLTRRAAHYSYPVYSPDNSKIVFISGGASEHLFSELESHHSAFPDMKAVQREQEEIAGISSRVGLDLRSIPVGGGDSTFIAPTQGGQYPHFTSDPNRVYLTHGQQGLVSVRLDGLDRRTHLKVTGSAPGAGPQPPNADEIRLSPDGQQAFVDLQNKHYLVTIP
ncbi:MAG TPA: amidohydrolase, partial [Blastocatellia bacterium]|nr:amidohydrolase [Blastocatellia bacterium]